MFSRRQMRLASVELPSDINDFFRHHPAAPLELSLLTEAALEDSEQ
jgi:hypothetical protein